MDKVCFLCEIIQSCHIQYINFNETVLILKYDGPLHVMLFTQFSPVKMLHIHAMLSSFEMMYCNHTFSGSFVRFRQTTFG